MGGFNRYEVRLPPTVAPEKAKAVITMIEQTMAEDGEFALLRIPYQFPQERIPAAILRCRAVLDELQSEQGVSNEQQRL